MIIGNDKDLGAAVLAAGSRGLSARVCRLDNGDGRQTEATANLMGPCWRMDVPRTANGRLDRALADAGRTGLRRSLGP